MVINSIICEVASWVLVKKKFKDVSMTDIVRDWITCISISPSMKNVWMMDWVPPCMRKLKVNFDAASLGTQG